ncbi:MAG: exo-alpha-sialidase [Verrucomicrobia bacterium]|nr:exo-alpha-sialidase [Verrucomicrobiota bacterium]
MKTVLSLAFMVCVAANAAEPVTLVAFGDSTTALRGSLTVYATILQEELRGVRVINAGIGGNTTEMGRARFDKDVLAHKPAIAIIQFGINDSAMDVWKKPPATKPRVAPERYEANLRHFVETLKSRDARVILMTPNPLRWTPKLKEMYGKPPYKPDDPDGFNVLLDNYADIVRKVARETGAALVDAREAFAAQNRKTNETVDALLLDGMHPNDRGQRLVAELLIDHLLAMAKREGLPIREGPRWKPSGTTVLLNPLCTDITHDSPNPVVLGCGLAKLADGAVMTVYSTPSSYYSPPGSTYIACRLTRDGGKTWSPEREVTRHSDCQASHASVLRTRDGTIHAFYLGFKKHSWKDGNPTPEEQSDVWAIQSGDGGKTWTNRQVIFRGYSGATNGAIETRDGHILVPYSHYVSNPGRLVSRVSISTDGGKSWTLGTAIDIGGAGDHEGALEPALLELKDGRVWMLIRTSRGQFWESFSTDGGLTWSEAKPTAIESTHAPGHLARLADGRIALVWNQRKKGRGELHLAFSSDEGRAWTPSLVLARGRQVSYPFVIEIEPGDLWVGYHDVPKGWMLPRARHLRVSARPNSTGTSDPSGTR